MKWEYRGLSGRREELDDETATLLWQEKAGHAMMYRTPDKRFVWLFAPKGRETAIEEYSAKSAEHLLRHVDPGELTDEGLALLEEEGWEVEELKGPVMPPPQPRE